MLTLEESYQEYFHYLAGENVKFIFYREWKKLLNIQVETSPRIAALAKKMGYPGGTDTDDIEYWVQGLIDDIWVELSKVPGIILAELEANFVTTGGFLVRITKVLANLISDVSVALSYITQTLQQAIIKLNYSIESTIAFAKWGIDLFIQRVQAELERAYQLVEDSITATLLSVENSFTTIIEWATETLQEFYENIKGGFSGIADAIIAGIDAIAKVIIAIIDGVAFVISSAIKVLGESIVEVVHSVERMITDILETASTTIEEALTTIGGVMLEISHRVFSFMENIFPEDVNVLADGLAFIFEAQRLAAEKIRAKVGVT